MSFFVFAELQVYTPLILVTYRPISIVSPDCIIGLSASEGVFFHSGATLYNRQTDTVDLLIDVERIDVGHAADVINNRHDALLQILVFYIILAAYPAQELLGIETR